MTANFYAGMIPFFPTTETLPCPYVTYHPASSFAMSSGNVTGLDLFLVDTGPDPVVGGGSSYLDTPLDFDSPCRDQWALINIDWSIFDSIAADMQSWGQGVIHDNSAYDARIDFNVVLAGYISFGLSIQYGISSVDVIGQFVSEDWSIDRRIAAPDGGVDILNDHDFTVTTGVGSTFTAYPGFTMPSQFWVHQTWVTSAFPGTFEYTLESNYAPTVSYFNADMRDFDNLLVLRAAFGGWTIDQDENDLWGAIPSLTAFSPEDPITSCGWWTGPGRVLGDLTL